MYNCSCGWHWDGKAQGAMKPTVDRFDPVRELKEGVLEKGTAGMTLER